LSADFQINEGSRLFFTVGRYVQRPPFEDLYFRPEFLEYKVRTGGYNYPFANPALEPTEAVSFELGLSQSLTEFGDLRISGFTKSFEHLTAPKTFPASPNSYTMLAPAGDATAKGLEMSARMNRRSGIAAQIAYTLTVISNDKVYANTQDNIAWTNAQPPRVTGPFTFEQEHRFVGFVDFRAGTGAGPTIAEWHPFENAGITALFEAGSGYPYSPTTIYNELSLYPLIGVPAGPLGSETTPAIYRLDLKANKTLAIGRAELEIYIWVINLFDRDNVAFVYSGTGEPDNTGWLETDLGQQFISDNATIHDASLLTGEQKYELRQSDPANFDIPRQIRVGIRAGF
jgi:outer membrane receptor protein involved in Fe transport